MKLFNKLRKKRISNKINKLTSKREELQGIPQGYFEQPAWDEGGKEVVDITLHGQPNGGIKPYCIYK